MTPALTKEEQDFVRWMDEVDLEEVNLLGAGAELTPEAGDDWGAARPRENTTGERTSELPPQRGVGWDEG
jgi:hypothetical protein